MGAFGFYGAHITSEPVLVYNAKGKKKKRKKKKKNNAIHTNTSCPHDGFFLCLNSIVGTQQVNTTLI